MSVGNIYPGPERRIAQAQSVIDRLERLSADSYWAHRASGVRGALLRSVDKNIPDPGQEAVIWSEYRNLENLLRRGYYILEQAARACERNI